MVLVKTHDEIRAMAQKIRDEANNLPAENIFGESNVMEKQEAFNWARELERATAGLEIDEGEWPEVYRWLYGTGWSALEDYDG